MDKNCQELMDNIERTLHECRDNKRIVKIKDTFDMRECKNVSWWFTNIKNSVPLKIEIKNPILINQYSIEYNVITRSLIIS